MSFRVLRMLGYKPKCRICQAPIEQGDIVISKQTRKGAVHYHKKCYLKTFIDI